MTMFIAIVLTAFFDRVNPVSSIAKPTCMNITRKPPTSTQARLSEAVSEAGAWASAGVADSGTWALAAVASSVAAAAVTLAARSVRSCQRARFARAIISPPTERLAGRRRPRGRITIGEPDERDENSRQRAEEQRHHQCAPQAPGLQAARMEPFRASGQRHALRVLQVLQHLGGALVAVARQALDRVQDDFLAMWIDIGDEGLGGC